MVTHAGEPGPADWDQKLRCGAQGIERCTCSDWEEGRGRAALMRFPLKAGDGYSIAVQSGHAAAHTNGGAQRPQAVDKQKP